MSNSSVPRNIAFNFLLTATTVSSLGTAVTTLALPLAAITYFHADEFQIGMLDAVGSAAALLFGLHAGVLADRWDKKRIMIVCDVLRFMALVAIPIAAWLNVLNFPLLFVAAFLINLGLTYYAVADQSILPHVVDRSELEKANGRIQGAISTTSLAGPPLASALIAALTAPVALAFDAASYAISALCLTKIPTEKKRHEPVANRSVIADIREGVAFVLQHPLLRPLTWMLGLYNISVTIVLALFILLLKRDLQCNELIIGSIFSIMALGGMLGALVAKNIIHWLGQGKTILFSCIIPGPLLFMWVFAQPGWTLWIATLGLFFTMAAAVINMVTQMSARQRLCPDEMLGRMNASMRFVAVGCYPIGSVLAAVLGAGVGIRGALGACASCLFIIFSPIPKLRHLA